MNSWDHAMLVFVLGKIKFKHNFWHTEIVFLVTSFVPTSFRDWYCMSPSKRLFLFQSFKKTVFLRVETFSMQKFWYINCVPITFWRCHGISQILCRSSQNSTFRNNSITFFQFSSSNCTKFHEIVHFVIICCLILC